MKIDKDGTSNAPTNNDGRSTTDELAMKVFSWSFLFFSVLAVILLIIWVCVEVIFRKEIKLELGYAPDDIFNAILPLIGAWIGAVLGYYFSDRAAQARGDQVIEASERSRRSVEPLKSVDISKCMIPLSAIEKVVLEFDENGRITNPFRNLEEVVKRRGYTRAPMFKNERGNLILENIAHESVIYKYKAKRLEAGADIDKDTIQDFLDDDETAKTIGGTTAFIELSASLYDAKMRMEGTRGCQDVFVTVDGKSTSPVEGWLPNVLVLRKSIAYVEE